MRILIVALIVALSIQFSTPYADACGDKTMRVKTGLRYYQPLAAKHPSTILIHSAALPSGKAVELREFLNNKVGHKSTVMDDVSGIKNALRSTHYDLVLTTLAEAPDLQKQVDSFAPKTFVVPILFKQPKLEEQAAKKQYRVVLNNPKDGLDFMIAIARVMDSKSKKS
jgi:hypothetical protein